MGVLARVFLINPPSPEPVKTPLLALCYLASSLRRAGHEVALCEVSAPQPLTDEDRWPWLEAIGERIDAERTAGMGVVVSCSALKQAYRECLRKKVNGRVQFILLDGPRDLISKRMMGRKGHFMPQSLLDSQLATLEKPGPDEDAVILDISHNVPTLLVEAVQSVGR